MKAFLPPLTSFCLLEMKLQETGVEVTVSGGLGGDLPVCGLQQSSLSLGLQQALAELSAS